VAGAAVKPLRWLCSVQDIGYDDSSKAKENGSRNEAAASYLGTARVLAVVPFELKAEGFVNVAFVVGHFSLPRCSQLSQQVASRCDGIGAPSASSPLASELQQRANDSIERRPATGAEPLVSLGIGRAVFEADQVALWPGPDASMPARSKGADVTQVVRSWVCVPKVRPTKLVHDEWQHVPSSYQMLAIVAAGKPLRWRCLIGRLPMVVAR
jgi:hypothetical protein